MSTKQSITTFILEQIEDAGIVTSRKMFGEFCIYCNGKVVALVCDDQLFVKPTSEGEAFVKKVEKAPPYPGAKPHLLIDADRWENREWLTELISITAASLPAPKARKKKP